MLKKVFLTTLQSPTVTAPLTRGAKVGFFGTLQAPALQVLFFMIFNQILRVTYITRSVSLFAGERVISAYTATFSSPADISALSIWRSE